ncbi:MAG: hypothetical protein H7067_15650 [Burkholderiales bacterium]|nr:hypothetical protein [Opitutaceae bacterium]
MIADDEGTMTDFVMVEPTGRVLSSSNRNNTPHGKAYVQAAAGTKTVPIWLRIKRTGFVFTAYKSTAVAPASESDWTVLATFDMYRAPVAPEATDYKSPAVLDQRMHYGLFINSGSATTSASATFTGVAATGPAAPAGVDLLVEESFGYAVGTTNPDPDGGANTNNGLPATNSIDENNVGVGFSGNYGADQSVVSGLTYSNAGGTLFTSDNALRRATGTGWSSAMVRNYRQLANDPFAAYRSVASANTFGWNGSSATQLYFSVLLNVNAVNTADNLFVVNLGLDNSSWNVYLGHANATGKWRYSDQSGNGADLGTAVANQTVLIVGRLSFNSATQFVTEYWFNPTLGQPLGTPTYSKTYTTTTSGGQFNGIQTRDGTNILTYDEFRLGTTLSSVTPLQ